MATATILVVDSHPEALLFAKRALLHASYKVLTATSGQAALELLEARPPVDLLLSEALLPGISGSQLLGQVKRSSPSTATVLMTGFTDELLDPVVPFLQKPFTTAALMDRVQAALGQGREAVTRFHELRSECRKIARETRAVVADVKDSALRSAKAYLEAWCIVNGGRPVVIVAEDDPAFRYTVCHFLSQHGFEVLEAAGGQEGLSLSRAHSGALRALVTDVRMPGMDGLELARIVGAECPDTAVVFMTGETLDAQYRALRKPFEMQDLFLMLIRCLSDQ